MILKQETNRDFLWAKMGEYKRPWDDGQMAGQRNGVKRLPGAGDI